MNTHLKIILVLVLMNFLSLISIGIPTFTGDYYVAYFLAIILFVCAGVFGIGYSVYRKIKGDKFFNSLIAPFISLLTYGIYFIMFFLGCVYLNIGTGDCGMGIIALFIYGAIICGIFILLFLKSG